jgi:Zn-dependent protease
VKLILLALAGVKFGKLATTGGTMLISLVIYATIWGWPYAAGFIALLFAHEIGHVIAARQRGLPVSAPAFIPFMGAFITLRGQPENVETEAHVALGGPLLGTVAAFGMYFWARAEDSQLLLAISYAGFFLNLFNLLPISPLDGGRITAVLGPRVWFLGVPILLALMLWRPSPVLILVAILAVPQVTKAWRYDPAAPENAAYYGIPAKTKFEYTALYLGLAALLALMTEGVHEMLGPTHSGW